MSCLFPNFVVLQCFRRKARVGLGRMIMWGLNILFMVEKGFSGRSDKRFFHVCTNGTALDWMFKDDIDFIHGINRIAICRHLIGVDVVSHVLMDNHVHFLLYGMMSGCKEFINKYKHLTGKYIYSRYGIEGHLRGLDSKIIPVEDEENLLAVLAYIDRNPIVAGFRLLPTEYPWGSARYMFKRDSLSPGPGAKRIGDMSKRAVQSLLGTRMELPDDWMIDKNGMILPCFFMDIALAESVFKTPGRYLYYLSKKLEGDIDASISKWNSTFIPDKDLRIVVEQLAQSMGGNKDIRTLAVQHRLSIARKLKYDYASTPKQIARLLHLDLEILKGYV